MHTVLNRWALSATDRTVGYTPLWSRGTDRLPPAFRRLRARRLNCSNSMLAYTGTFTLHEDHVVHQVDVSWNQAWSGTDQKRFYKLDGSMLEIWGAPAPDPYTGRTVAHRMTFEKWAPDK